MHEGIEVGTHRTCRADHELKLGRGPMKLFPERSSSVNLSLDEILKMDRSTAPLNWFLLTFLERNPNFSADMSEGGFDFTCTKKLENHSSSCRSETFSRKWPCGGYQPVTNKFCAL